MRLLNTLQDYEYIPGDSSSIPAVTIASDGAYTELVHVVDVDSAGASGDCQIKEPYFYDVHSFFEFFDLLPSCPHFLLIFNVKCTQPHLVHLLFGEPHLLCNC